MLFFNHNEKSFHLKFVFKKIQYSPVVSYHYYFFLFLKKNVYHDFLSFCISSFKINFCIQCEGSRWLHSFACGTNCPSNTELREWEMLTACSSQEYTTALDDSPGLEPGKSRSSVFLPSPVYRGASICWAGRGKERMSHGPNAPDSYYPCLDLIDFFKYLFLFIWLCQVLVAGYGV